jgi:hypothetical protein
LSTTNFALLTPVILAVSFASLGEPALESDIVRQPESGLCAVVFGPRTTTLGTSNTSEDAVPWVVELDSEEQALAQALAWRLRNWSDEMAGQLEFAKTYALECAESPMAPGAEMALVAAAKSVVEENYWREEFQLGLSGTGDGGATLTVRNRGLGRRVTVRINSDGVMSDVISVDENLNAKQEPVMEFGTGLLSRVRSLFN